MVDPRIGLLIATVATGAVAMVFAIRLPRSYTLALEDSLVARGDPDSAGAAKPFVTWPIGGPILGQAGDLSPLPLRILDHPRRRGPAVAPSPAQRDQVSLRIAELRSQDPDRIKRALATALAVQTDDSALRETALEYLESILPADVRIQLWPLLEPDSTMAEAAVIVADPLMPVRNARSKEELVAALHLAYPSIRASLLDKRPPSA
jgi:hypothetical protein